jgi:hypothetical protein
MTINERLRGLPFQSGVFGFRARVPSAVSLTTDMRSHYRQEVLLPVTVDRKPGRLRRSNPIASRIIVGSYGLVPNAAPQVKR